MVTLYDKSTLQDNNLRALVYISRCITWCKHRPTLTIFSDCIKISDMVCFSSVTMQPVIWQRVQPCITLTSEASRLTAVFDIAVFFHYVYRRIFDTIYLPMHVKLPYFYTVAYVSSVFCYRIVFTVFFH